MAKVAVTSAPLKFPEEPAMIILELVEVENRVGAVSNETKLIEYPQAGFCKVVGMV